MEYATKSIIGITITEDDYCGVKLPTLRANGIPILHLLPDGRIAMRSDNDTNLEKLEGMGFQTIAHHMDNKTNSRGYKILKAVPSGYLTVAERDHRNEPKL